MIHHTHLQGQNQSGETWGNCVREIAGIRSGQRFRALYPSVLFGVAYIIPEKFIVMDWPVSLILYVD
jgi:hypothetical protein